MRKLLDELTKKIQQLKIRSLHSIYGIESIVRHIENAPSSIIVPTLRQFGASIGSDTYAKGPLFIDNAFGDEDATDDFSHLKIGERCYIGKCVSLDISSEIILDDEVLLSSGVTILTHQDCGQRRMKSFFSRKAEPVVIHNGAWIGAQSTVLAGVTIGELSVVGAGSVVTCDVPPLTVVAGVPAREIRKLHSISIP